MALSLKEIQAKLLAQEANKERARSGVFGGDNTVYPFWNNPDGTVATMRFLPDGDETNDFFWRERLIIKLPFAGIKGQDTNKPVSVQVPCTDMWKNGTCQVTAQIRPWWKDDSLKEMARKYYRKKSYLFQGFVVENPNKEDQTPENPIRRFIINTSVFDRIKSILLAQDIENSPVDFDKGIDFYLVKKTKGPYANYDESGWLRPGSLAVRTRSLSDTELAAIQQHGLWNLNSFLPKKPDDGQLKAISELFEASVNGEYYDADRWGQYYKPAGFKTDSSTPDTSGEMIDEEATPIARPVTQSSNILSKLMASKTSAETKEVAESVAQPATPVTSMDKPKAQTPEEIIKALRARKQAS